MNRVTIEYGSAKFDVSIHFSDRENMSIKVYPDGEVKVSAPSSKSDEVVIAKIRQKAPWILKQVSFFNLFKPKTPPRKFVNGETHLYLGRQYRLKITEADSAYIKLYRGYLYVGLRTVSKEEIEQELGKWYRQRAKSIFDEVLKELLPKFDKYRLPKQDMIIRYMSKRWGSCTVNGKIVLNPELIKAPKGCIEYVIIHELCHLVHHNHTKAFYDLQSKIMPDWGKWKSKLEQVLI